MNKFMKNLKLNSMKKKALKKLKEESRLIFDFQDEDQSEAEEDKYRFRKTGTLWNNMRRNLLN